jgi:hypothetical protein
MARQKAMDRLFTTSSKITTNAHGFFHPVISKSCEAMGVASQGAIVQSITERKKSCNRIICFILNDADAVIYKVNEQVSPQGRLIARHLTLIIRTDSSYF